jgi:DNA-binding PadR family transcriptional regulator
MELVMRSRSRYVVLGILSVEPMSGYDIKKFIETSVAHFWSESYGNLYPLLARLAEEKLVRRREHRQQGKPDRLVYSLTARGRAEFLQWLGEPVSEEPVRSELMMKLFFGRHLASDRIGAHLEACRETQSRILAALRGTRKMLERDHADHPDVRYWLLTLRRGELVAKARLQWAREGLRDFAESSGNQEKEP